MAQIGKNHGAKAGCELRVIILGTKPHQVLYLGMRGGIALEITCVQGDPYGLAVLSGSGAFVVAEMFEVQDLDIAQFFATLAPQAFFGGLARF